MIFTFNLRSELFMFTQRAPYLSSILQCCCDEPWSTVSGCHKPINLNLNLIQNVRRDQVTGNPNTVRENKSHGVRIGNRTN